jgi:alpha-galactosidase
LVTLYGSWANENNREEVRIGHGRLVNESTCGLSSARHNPFFLLKEKGANNKMAFAMALTWSIAATTRNPWNSTPSLRFISKAAFRPFISAKASSKGLPLPRRWGSWPIPEKGRMGSRHLMQRFRQRLRDSAAFQRPSAPVVYNNWEATTFKFNKTKLIALMKRRRFGR